MTTDRILASIDEEIARLKKVCDRLSTSTAAAKDNTASPVRKRRKLSEVCPEEDRRRAAEALGPSKREVPPGSRSDFCTAERFTGRRPHQLIVSSAK